MHLEGIVLAFFDKIGDFAKSVGDKTGGMIETTKIRDKIKAENDAIIELQKQIGELCWNKFESGVQFDEDINGLLEQIKAGYERIARYEEEIEAIAKASEAAGDLTCQSCGTVNPAGTNFCSTCGTKIQPPPPADNAACIKCGAMNPADAKFCIQCGAKIEKQAASGAVVCPNCSASNSEGTRFCVQCGTNIEAASKETLPRLCPSCGAEVGPDAVFCGECGQKLS